MCFSKVLLGRPCRSSGGLLAALLAQNICYMASNHGCPTKTATAELLKPVISTCAPVQLHSEYRTLRLCSALQHCTWQADRIVRNSTAEIKWLRRKT